MSEEFIQQRLAELSENGIETINSLRAEISALNARVEELDAALEFVERWAVYKRYKPDGKNLTAEEAIGIIAFSPPIRAITERFEAAKEIDVAAYERDRAALTQPKEPEYFTDLEGTIPAKEGDRVALAKNFGGPGVWARSDAPHQRPTLRDGKLWFEGDESAALTQPAQDVPSPWRPIETAPKDGTVVLVFAAAREGLSAFQCTAAYHEDAGWCVDELREATHWMPLPPAPENGGE